MDRGLFDRVCREASNLSEHQLREVLTAITRFQRRARKKPARASRARKSFRRLTAFGIWANRTDTSEPVRFTAQLRRRMERGEDSKHFRSVPSLKVIRAY